MLFFFLLFTSISYASSPDSQAWSQRLEVKFAAIEKSLDGVLGVYVKRLKDGAEASHRASPAWYLSSTTKVPIAVFLLKSVEAGRISLSQELSLQSSDFVDGAGETKTLLPGKKIPVGQLLRNMLVQSDSTATDMLVRLVGEDALNEFLQEEGGFSRFTTILQVRYDAYGELHPRAQELSNLDFLALQSKRSFSARRIAFAERLGISPSQLHAASLEEAFTRYYRKGWNSGSLKGYGKFLQRLVEGKLLSPAHTDLVLGHMRAIITGERRIKAGLPKRAVFAQKTGTQVRRICNVGIAEIDEDSFVVAACVRDFSSQPAAERGLRLVGRALSEATSH